MKTLKRIENGKEVVKVVDDETFHQMLLDRKITVLKELKLPNPDRNYKLKKNNIKF